MEFRLLTREELEKSDIFNIYGLRSEITDFAIFNSDKSKKNYLDSDFKLVTDWLIHTPSSFPRFKYMYVTPKGYVHSEPFINSYHTGTRPVVKYSSIMDYVKNVKEINEDICEVECFSYPQSIVDKITSNILEEKFWKRDLEETGKIYIVNNKYEKEIWNKDKNLNMIEYAEYFYDGDKYVRCGCPSTSPLIFLPSGCGKIYVPDEEERWIKVEPIKFLVDKKLDFAISEKCLISGMPLVKVENFDNYKKENRKWEITDLYKYLNTYFIKDIIPSDIYYEGINKAEKAEVLIKLSGDKEKIIKVLSKIKDISLSFEEKKTIIRRR